MMFLWILIVLGVLILITCGLLSILRWRSSRHLRHLPTFSHLPIIGNAHHLLGDGKNLLNVINEIAEKTDDTNLPGVFWVVTHPVLVISDIDDAKLVSNAFVEKPYFYNFINDLLGDGIGTAPAKVWNNNIKKLGGSFSHEIVSSYQENFNALTKKLVKLWKTKVDDAFNIEIDLASLTLEGICETALGVRDASNMISVEKYLNALTKILEIMTKRSVNVYMHPYLIFKGTQTYKELMEHVTFLHSVSKLIINKYKQKQSEQGTKKFLENPKFRHKSYMEILLNMNLTEQELIYEVITIIFGGQEALSAELFYIFQNIGSKKDVQEKLYKEMKEIFGDSKRDVRTEDLDRMVYCEAVINETLRLYPTAPMASIRRVERDFKIKSCNIPKGASCILSAWGCGRSKRLWGPDALEFNPDRWSIPSNNTSKLMTFSIGKRACIGKRYALPFMKTILAYCIREFTFESDFENLDLKLDIVLTATKGNLTRLKLREEKKEIFQKN